MDDDDKIPALWESALNGELPAGVKEEVDEFLDGLWRKYEGELPWKDAGGLLLGRAGHRGRDARGGGERMTKEQAAEILDETGFYSRDDIMVMLTAASVIGEFTDLDTGVTVSFTEDRNLWVEEPGDDEPL